MIAAIDWVVQHQHDNGLNIRVLNLSYGTNSTQNSDVDPLSFAVEQAWKKASSWSWRCRQQRLPGRRRRTGVADPAYNPFVIAVGGSDSMGTPTRSRRRRRRLLGQRALQRPLQAARLRRARLAPAGPSSAELVHRRDQPEGSLGRPVLPRAAGRSEAAAVVSGQSRSSSEVPAR